MKYKESTEILKAGIKPSLEKIEKKPLYEMYCPNGIPHIVGDKITFYQKKHIDIDTHIKAFYAALPQGRVECEVLTPTQKEIEKVKVSLYDENSKLIGHGVGRSLVEDGQVFEPVASAYSLAFKNAMRMSGFLVDINLEQLSIEAGLFVEDEFGNFQKLNEAVNSNPNTPKQFEEKENIQEIINEEIETKGSDLADPALEMVFGAEGMIKKEEEIDEDLANFVIHIKDGFDGKLRDFNGKKISELPKPILKVLCTGSNEVKNALDEKTLEAIKKYAS